MIYRRNTSGGGTTCPGSRVPQQRGSSQTCPGPSPGPVPRQVRCLEPIKYGLIVRHLGMENQD